jgi:predicted molibdopterin-dependent oxidoreductase YjgC
VIGIGLFTGSFGEMCDLILPGTSYLERDGTTVNLEGRLQRQRRAVIAACPDELAWIANLGERFDVEISPYASTLFEEISEVCYGGIPYGEIGEHATLPPRAEPARAAAPVPVPVAAPPEAGLRLLTYRPLFSGPAVERTPELHFQRPQGEVELARADARARNISPGDAVNVSSNGTTLSLRAKIARDLRAGTVRIAGPDAGDLPAVVEVTK